MSGVCECIRGCRSCCPSGGGARRLQSVVVVHANHANEVDAGVRAALARLKGVGVVLLNQSVLLRGVNDRVETLADLSEALFAAGGGPYYLHMLDRGAGGADCGV